MATITIHVPDKNYKYLGDESEVQSVITETILDYIEMKQDNDTKKTLENNSYFSALNHSLEQKLGKL